LDDNVFGEYDAMTDEAWRNLEATQENAGLSCSLVVHVMGQPVQAGVKPRGTRALGWFRRSHDRSKGCIRLKLSKITSDKLETCHESETLN
jgi:hypothetical protein